MTSTHYQYKFREILLPELFFDRFIFGHESEVYKEKLDELQQQLINNYWRLIYDNCTPHQIHILSLLAQGYTQKHIAHTLNLLQCTVQQCVFGSKSSIKNRLKKVIKKDMVIQDILKQIKEL
jgi:DNA-binding NarL/FixJ family response regulator